MQGLAVILVVIAALASRPIEVRLWRAGRLSDRATALLVLARFPMLTLFFGLVGGASLPLLIGLTALASVGPALGYQFMLGLLREQSRA